MAQAQLPPVFDADFTEVRDERRAERRRTDRRTGRERFTTLFAATLVNHVARPEAVNAARYPQRNKLRAGIAFDVKA